MVLLIVLWFQSCTPALCFELWHFGFERRPRSPADPRAGCALGLQSARALGGFKEVFDKAMKPLTLPSWLRGCLEPANSICCFWKLSLSVPGSRWMPWVPRIAPKEGVDAEDASKQKAC